MGRLFCFRLYDRTQQGLMGTVPVGSTRCVLLSKLYLCSRIYNMGNSSDYNQFVVYCFQNCIFAVEYTTATTATQCPKQLCIAFKIVSLQ